MSDFPDEYDDDDELDLAVDPDETDEGTTAIIESTRWYYQLGADEETVAAELSELPDNPTLRDLFDRAVRLRQILGDKDAMISDLVADIASGLQTLMIELKTDPSNLVMSVLATQCAEHQIVHIQRLQGLLEQRLETLAVIQTSSGEEV